VRPLTEKIEQLERDLAAVETRVTARPSPFKLQMRDTRRFVMSRLGDLRAVFKQDPRTVREEIARHMPSITLTVESGKYVATGFWDWMGGGNVRFWPPAPPILPRLTRFQFPEAT
jgi:hypothetical protein